jgi:hypothetical protein
MAAWVPLFVLPNLLVKEPVEVEYVALAPPSDPRCAEIAKTNTNFYPFLNSFTDAFQRQVIPAVLIARADAPSWVMSMDAIAGFRDAISISAVVHNRTNTILYGHARTNQYSTFFDFYAWVFSKDFNLLTTHNPALAGLDEFKDFKGQSTPGIPTSRWDGLEYDETLLKTLLGEWPRRFSNPSPAWRSLALFRSLNMAHAAAQLPGYVDLTAQSLGRSVALWISAFEILTHPKNGDAGLKEVYRVFDSVDWRTEACKELIYECYEGRGKRKAHMPKRNLACWLYGELYHARNDYLHGNQIADDRLVMKSTGRSLFVYTQSLYRLLLTGFLGIDYYGPFEPRPRDGSFYSTPEGVLNFRFENRQGDHERAIARILKPKDKRD